jgi:hypothetical protein
VTRAWPFVVAGSLMLSSALATAASGDMSLDLGRDLYFGARAFEQAPRVADTALRVDSAACVSCHGPLGAGSREGAQAAPAITAAALMAAHHEVRGMAPESVAEHPWVRAAARGMHADGSPLSAAMPRYRPSAAERAALAAYAQVIGSATDTVRGVSEREIVFGLPEFGVIDAQVLQDVQRGVERAFAQANARGGVHGRMLRLLRVPADAPSLPVFAWIASLARLPQAEPGLDAARRRPSLASLALERDDLASRGVTAPLLPALREQAQLLARALADAAGAESCTSWLVDTVQAVPDSEAVPEAVRRLTSVDAAMAERPTFAGARLCLALVARTDEANALVQALRRAGIELPWVGGLAAAGPLPALPASTRQVQVLPTPLALAAHAGRAGQRVWSSLGEAAGHAVVEALARSGRLLQPELVLEQLRGLTGFAPIDGAPLAWSTRRTHGWLPSLLNLTPAPAFAAGPTP